MRKITIIATVTSFTENNRIKKTKTTNIYMVFSQHSIKSAT